jgi:hypothetical protein
VKKKVQCKIVFVIQRLEVCPEVNLKKKNLEALEMEVDAFATSAG